MAIGTVGPASNTQLQALMVVRATERRAAANPDADTSTIPTTAAGLKISGRTAASLSEILQSSKVDLGYSKEETQAFTAMIKSARDYLDNIKQWAAGQAAAAASTDPDKLEIDKQFYATPEGQNQQRAVKAYDPEFIAKMETNLDQVMNAFLGHRLVFQSSSISTIGTVNISAKTFKQGMDGNLQTDLDFSFFQSPIDEPKRSKTDPVHYAATWSVNDMRLFKTGVDRVL